MTTDRILVAALRPARQADVELRKDRLELIQSILGPSEHSIVTYEEGLYSVLDTVTNTNDEVTNHRMRDLAVRELLQDVAGDQPISMMIGDNLFINFDQSGAANSPQASTSSITCRVKDGSTWHDVVVTTAGGCTACNSPNAPYERLTYNQQCFSCCRALGGVRSMCQTTCTGAQFSQLHSE